MKFVYDWLPKDKYRIVTDFKADRRIKRTLKQDLTLVYNMTGEARPPTGQRSSSCSEETRRK